ncbi:B12-binding domain-containing radical SAM protein [Cellulosilyticum sp. I15G10I2]|uniref:B12-binding domain-containing radical SAM protein n=1 Tax=Cellulosilyticum sp. I15G10I2 TaxID=1892843 RepID=UPI00085C01F8|nr:radical SAM protein [Cellulosilyticum sp. I15G10I2]
MGNNKLKVLLVRPPRIKQAVTLGEFMYAEPIGLECIYAVLKESYEVQILDLMIQGEDFEKTCEAFKPDVVGITSLCIDVKMVKEIARRAKQFNKDVITIVGGTQAYLRPGSFFDESIDHVFCYTTTENLKALFQCIAYGQIPPLMDGILSKAHAYQSTWVFGRNEYIVPDRTSTEKYRKHYSYLGFKPCAIMQTSLGCSKNCDFCLRWRIEGAKEKDIELECIMSQIQDITEASIMIFDNDFLNNKDRLEKFCDLLESLKITKNFICYASVKSIRSHPDTIRRMAKNGLKAVLVGYETFNQEEMINYKKKSTVADSFEAAKILKDIGIDCWASFMLHPDWDGHDFKRFRKTIKELKPEIATFSPLTPFPNLPLYERYKDRLLFDETAYESWSFGKVTIKPSKMTLRQYYGEVLKTILFINLRMNSVPYMIKRFGFATLFRIGLGSIKVLPTYIKLMFES